MVFLRRVRTLLIAGLLTSAFAFAFAPAGASAAAGDVDAAFGVGGTAISGTLPNMTGGSQELMALPDGKILAFGGVQFFFGVPDIAVARFNADGSPDTSFSGDGLVTITLPGATYAAAVNGGVQPSGKIIVTAQGQYGSNFEFVVIRLNDNGTLDDTFDGESGTANGIVRQIVSPVGPPLPTDRAWDSIVEPSGRIVMAGESASNVPMDFNLKIAMARFNSDGTLDDTFSGDGLSVLDPGSSVDRSLSIAAHPLGGYVISGQAPRRFAGPTSDVLALYRITDAGAFDASFVGDAANQATSTPGVVIVEIGSETDDLTAAWAVAVQSDGRILAGGWTRNGPTSTDFPFVARFLANGSFDTSFGVNGRSIFNFPNDNGSLNDIELDAAGRIYGAGVAYGAGPQTAALARLTPTGSVDTSYGTGGTVVPSDFGSTNGIALQPDGKQLVAGGGESLRVARLLADPPLVPISALVPTATITSPKSKSVKRKRLKRFAGTAGPAGNVAKVEIALQQVDKRLLKKRKRCRWLSSSKAKFKVVKATKGKCTKPRFLKARGTESWSYKLSKPLPKGSYRLLVRVTLTDGNAHQTFTAAGNLRAFRVK